MRPLAGCIPITRDNLICFVTSKAHPDTYVLPKGGVEIGELLSETAEREAAEEAGIEGLVEKDLGEIEECRWFLLRINKIYDKWPEMMDRQRVWIPVSDILDRPDIRRKSRLAIQRLLGII